MLDLRSHDDSYEIFHQGQRLCRYVYRPDVAATESPKPYFHPIKSLRGQTLTDFRPTDHTWHTGLSMTMANLSGLNFWGGPSYVHGQGYVQLPNNGQIQHTSWSRVEYQGHQTRLDEQLAWWTPDRSCWVEETRCIIAAIVDDTSWYLDLRFQLLNVSGQTLEFGSPTTQGRPNAGYGGLFWRGPLAWANPRIRLADGSKYELGASAAWLAYSGGAPDQRATLLFLDHPSNPRFPNQWFARDTEYIGVCFAFMFDTAYFLPPDESLILHYRVVIADGELPADACENLVRAFVTED